MKKSYYPVTFGRFKWEGWAVRVPQGVMFPEWYGLAWREVEYDASVAVPIPFNVLARVVRAAFLWVRFPFAPWHPQEQERYFFWERQGIRKGYVRGYEAATLGLPYEPPK